jgi:hypothetical protein
MNAMTSLSLTIPMPKIFEVSVVDHLVVRVIWSAGIRAGRTDVVDLSPMVNLLKHYRPLRSDRELFRTVHLIEDGRILAWGDSGEIDMAADSVEELAEEMMTPQDLANFLSTYRLTHNEAAVRLGRSRRQIENYLSGNEPIPRIVVMACFGLIARRQKIRGSTITTPSQILTETSPGTETKSAMARGLSASNLNFPETSAA